jgi:peptidyl-prolyl cis-trans isomerase D
VDILVKLANKLEDQLAGGAQLEEAGAALNFPVAKFTGMDVSGQNTNGVQLKNLPRGAEFLESAFASEMGQTSDLVETSDGGYFVLHVDAIHEPKLKPYEKVRADVAKSWKINNRDEAAKKRATEILEQIKGGATFASVAKKNNLAVTVSKEFTRFDQPQGSNISPSLAAELFRGQRGGAAMARTRTGHAVAQLKDIRMASPGADKKGMDALRDQLTTAIGNDLRTQFNTALKSRHPVSIDRGAMERLFNYTDGRR